eukprot:COSAG02_NODE_691_length_18445_cov_23.541099_13_plen_95_part_00
MSHVDGWPKMLNKCSIFGQPSQSGPREYNATPYMYSSIRMNGVEFGARDRWIDAAGRRPGYPMGGYCARAKVSGLVRHLTCGHRRGPRLGASQT